MPQISDENSADTIEITPPFDIPIIEPFGPCNDDRIIEEGLGRLIVHKGPPQQVLLSGIELHISPPGRIYAQSTRIHWPLGPIQLSGLVRRGYAPRPRTAHESPPESQPGP